MKLTRTNGNSTVTVDGNTHVDVFTNFSKAQEVFLNADASVCGKCGCNEIRYVVRKTEGKHLYYELNCTNRKCFAKYTFGLMNDESGDMFPHRKWPKGHPNEGDYIPDNGWKKFNKETNVEE